MATVISPLSISERLHSSLNQPSLILRCQEVSQLLQEVSNKDGSFVLHNVIESIFGTTEEGATNLQQQQMGGGWGLRIITFTEHRLEYQAMREFLSPTGPLLNLIYRLSHDPFQLLPFPVSLLPLKVRTEIQEGNAGPFYTNRMQNSGPWKTPTNILFNAFEYYIFHFGYFLVGRGAQCWNLYWTSVVDSLYPTLLEDYLSTYLSCDATLPPGPLSAPPTPRGILSPISQRILNVNNTSNIHTPSISLSPMATHYRPYDYNPRVDGSIQSNCGGIQQTSPIYPSVTHHAEVSTWTSQTLIQMLMEIWINVCVSPPAFSSTHHSTVAGLPTPVQSSMNSPHPSLKDVFVPVGDHVRAVRMTIKHFHTFANSLKSRQSTPLDPLRRNIWPMCRKSLYYFVRHLFIHWPLDSSFRLVLETWLSYIQPWRYVAFTPLERSSGMASSYEIESHRSVDSKWKGFIAENLLFYTHLFNLLLKRILRLDLTSPKNAQILFRVAKVFSQQNLIPMIREVEDLYEATQLQKSFIGFVGNLASHPALPVQDITDGQQNLQQHSPQVIAQIVRTHVLEVERPNYLYTTMFGEEILKDIHLLLKQTKKSHDTLKAELEDYLGPPTAPSKESGGLLSFLKSLIDPPKLREAENSVEEIQKCVSHLDISLHHLSNLFNLAIPESSTQRTVNHSFCDSLMGTPEKVHVPDQVMTSVGLSLTDYGRYQLFRGLRRLDLAYDGDPDLRLICSYEIAIIVRLLYSLSKCLNTKYALEIRNSYYRKDILGNLYRVFLQSPQTIYECVRDIDGNKVKVCKNLPPRISFRKLANKWLLLFGTCLYVFLWLCGLSFSKITFQLVLPLLFSWIVVRVLTQKSIHISDSS